MTRFTPPDVNPAMTPEAQRVVSEASAQLDVWLADVFAGLEAEFAKKRNDIAAQLQRECQLFIDEEQRQSDSLSKRAASLKEASALLTPLDPEQNRVIEEIAAMNQLVSEESDARAARWTAFSNRLMALTETAVSGLLDEFN